MEGFGEQVSHEIVISKSSTCSRPYKRDTERWLESPDMA